MADLRKQIDRINYIAGYVVNESPQYRPIMDDSSFASMSEAPEAPPATQQTPDNTPAMSSPAPAQATGSTTPSAAMPAEPIAPSPTPAPVVEPVSAAPALPEPMMSEPPVPSIDPNPSNNPSNEELQKQIMTFQLDAMKKMSQKIDQLEGLLSSLNAQQAELHSEVEKVKDPSDVEKFEHRKEDSSPYYFNLNDMWNGNTFQGRMDNFNSKGIIKTKDGYVADFDQLPKLSSFEVKDSFEQI